MGWWGVGSRRVKVLCFRPDLVWVPLVKQKDRDRGSRIDVGGSLPSFQCDSPLFRDLPVGLWRNLVGQIPPLAGVKTGLDGREVRCTLGPEYRLRIFRIPSPVPHTGDVSPVAGGTPRKSRTSLEIRGERLTAEESLRKRLVSHDFTDVGDAVSREDKRPKDRDQCGTS